MSTPRYPSQHLFAEAVAAALTPAEAYHHPFDYLSAITSRLEGITVFVDALYSGGLRIVDAEVEV